MCTHRMKSRFQTPPGSCFLPVKDAKDFVRSSGWSLLELRTCVYFSQIVSHMLSRKHTHTQRDTLANKFRSSRWPLLELHTCVYSCQIVSHMLTQNYTHTHTHTH